VDAGARRGLTRDPRLDLAALIVLVVNAGSTSLKLHLVDGDRSEPVDSLEAGAGRADAVAHRVVHGGPRFREPVVIDGEVREQIRELEALAPLHNTPALQAIERAQAVLPGVPHVAVFDTAFHATIPAVAATYAVPAEWGVRRYGFQGLSVQWASEQVRVPRLVVCHLGGGCSVTAVRAGRSLDTTMGFTPLEGVPMATRSGSVDPGAILYAQSRGADVEHDLNYASGLLGLAGTGDVRELEAREDDAARLALDVFCYRVAAAVGAMAVALGGVDAIVFTGGIGEHSRRVREGVCSRLGFLGDVAIEVVEAHEELVAAREARRVLTH
jgi:acetate kinase